MVRVKSSTIRVAAGAPGSGGVEWWSAQFSQLASGNQAGLQHAMADQIGQAFGILDVGIAAGNRSDMAGVPSARMRVLRAGL